MCAPLSALALNFVCMYIIRYMCSERAIERESERGRFIVQTAAIDPKALCLVYSRFCCFVLHTAIRMLFQGIFSINFDLVEKMYLFTF